MSSSASAIETLYSKVEPLFGRTPEDPELELLLRTIGMWPVPEFKDDDVVLYFSDKKRGLSLFFDDSDRVKHPLAVGKPPRSRLFVAVYFFAEGVEDNSAFPGKLPLGILWTDTADSLVQRLGKPEAEIRNKKTGVLTSHRFPAPPYVLTAAYLSGGAAMKRVYFGIK